MRHETQLLLMKTVDACINILVIVNEQVVEFVCSCSRISLLLLILYLFLDMSLID